MNTKASGFKNNHLSNLDYWFTKASSSNCGYSACIQPDSFLENSKNSKLLEVLKASKTQKRFSLFDLSFDLPLLLIFLRPNNQELKELLEQIAMVRPHIEMSGTGIVLVSNGYYHAHSKNLYSKKTFEIEPILKNLDLADVSLIKDPQDRLYQVIRSQNIEPLEKFGNKNREVSTNQSNSAINNLNAYINKKNNYNNIDSFLYSRNPNFYFSNPPSSDDSSVYSFLMSAFLLYEGKILDYKNRKAFNKQNAALFEFIFWSLYEALTYIRH